MCWGAAFFTLIAAVASLLRNTAAGEIGYCSSGYAVSLSALITTFPEDTVWNASRSQLECWSLCVQRRGCLQAYFNSTAGECYIIQSSIDLQGNAGDSMPGKLLTAHSPEYPIGGPCSGVTCPAESMCVPDCSGLFWGWACVVNNTMCTSATEILNVNHYFTARYEDGSDAGIVQTVIYNKTLFDTAVRVQWYATTGASYNTSGICGRYFVTFNGAECTNPDTIDFANCDYIHNDQHRFSEIDGICYGLPAGIVNISINVGARIGWVVPDSYTGWIADRTMWVSEIQNPSMPATCSELPVFNVQYLTFYDPYNFNYLDSRIMSMAYTKVASHTALRIKWLATTGISVPNDMGHCIRWYVTVNGTECNPKIEFVVGMYTNSYRYAPYNRRTRTMEGLCYNLTAGTYNLAVTTGACYYATNQAISCTGCYGSVSRFIVDEVRIASKVQAVTTPIGQILKLPFFNFQHYSWYLIDYGSGAANVLIVEYHKWSDTSGLHLHMMGDARINTTGGCCRWYFTIDGAECSDPGVIEGVSYTETNVNYHNPGVIDGVCYGYLSGAHTIRYNVGTCGYGYRIADCYTGWGSTINIMVEEVQPEKRITCNNPFLC